MSATYLKHGRGESLNSLEAKREGRHPASYWAKEIGKGVTATDIQNAIGTDAEWHHTGKYANRTPFYDYEDIYGNEDEDRPNLLPKIFNERDARKSQQVETFNARVVILDFEKRRGCGIKCVKRTYEGEVTIKCDWITIKAQALKDGKWGWFGTERLKLSGTRVESVTRLDN